MSYFGDASFSVQSAGNSTSTPLGISGTFTGVSELNKYPTIGLDVRTDVEGTVFTDFSVDGTNWTTFPVNGYALNALNNYTVVDTATKFARYVRLRVVNRSVAQGFLRAYMYYGVFDQLNSPLNQSYGLQSGSRLVRPTWTWLDVARGLAGGITSVKKFGRNPSVGTSFEPIADGGVYQTPQAASATTLRIKAGGNANDTAAGSGARAVTLIGLDENFNEATEVLVTAGASASASTVATFTRLYRIFVSASGAYASSTAGSHAGDITIEDSSGTNDWGIIDSVDFPKGQSEIGAYTIPAGKTGFVKLRNLSIDSGKTIDLVFFSRANADETAAPYTAMRAQSVVSGVSGGSIEEFGSVDVPFGPYVGPTDIGFMTKVGAGNASVSVEFEIFLVDE